MDMQSIVDIAIAVVGAFFGVFSKLIWDAIQDLQQGLKELQRDLRDTNQTLHEQYVRKEDYRIDTAEIKQMLLRIMDKLEAKADKE